MAAGLGTRMKSNLAKVLHQLDGRPLIAHVCSTAAELKPNAIVVVVGHQAGDVQIAVEAGAKVLALPSGRTARHRRRGVGS